MDRSFTPAELEAIFFERGIDADKAFLAAAGEYTGYVLAWELPWGEYLIMYGNENNGDRNYEVTDNADDLPSFLEDKTLYGLAAILQTANVRGPEYIKPAPDDAEAPFYIVKTRYWIDGKINDVVEDDDKRPRRFSTYSEAKAWIDAVKERPYENVPDEVGPPSYVIVAVPE
jgi:hypothetical protein